MKNKFIYFIVFVFLFINSSLQDVNARKLICIDSDPNDNGFLSNLEGWVRQNMNDGDEIHIGGSLSDCLAKAKNGDTIIIGCHGWGTGKGFKWGGIRYRGFGTGDSLHNVPPGFDTLKNVHVKFVSCWSERDPDGAGPDKSVTDKLKDKMGPQSNGNTVTGYTNRVFSGNSVSYTFDPQLTDTATINNFLRTGNQSWQKLPPVNRKPPAQQNQKTRLQELLDSVKGGAGKVTVSGITYKAPFNGTNMLLDTCYCNCNVDDDCGCTQTDIISIPICPTSSYDWTPQSSGVTSTFYSVHALNSKVCWVCGASATILKTTDGGATWISAMGSGVTGDVYNIYGIDADTAFCTTTPGSTFIYKTTNGGTTWTPVFTQSGGFINTILMTSEPEGYAAGDPVGGKWTILKTTDNGNSWSRMATEPTQIGSEAGWNNSFMVMDKYMWYGTNSTKVYMSSNYGMSWSGIPTPGVASSYALHFNNYVQGLAGGTGLVSTVSSGLSYMPATAPAATTSGLEGFGQTWWATAFNTNIYISINQGMNWAIAYTQTGSVYNDIDMASEGGCAVGWAVGNSGRIVKMSGDQLTALSLTAMIEGFGSIGDTLKVNVRKTVSPYMIVDIAQGKTDITGNVALMMTNPQLRNGDAYFLEVIHRNSIRTWSKAGGEVWTASTLNFDFTSSSSQAYGSNQTLVAGTYRFFGGDVNQDLIVDGADGLLVDNDAATFNTGYLLTDLNGDEIIDGSDGIIAENNAANFVSAVLP